MSIEQISIFLENKSGRLAEVTSVLSDAGINIRALYLADTADFGILRLIVNDTDSARQVLRDKGFTVEKTRVIAVEVPDRPGGLAEILDIIKGEGINVEYMYAFVEKSGENAIVIFRFDEIERSVGLLRKAGVAILEGEELSKL
ncbi:MAG: ACT domain-containing protein [Nitrospirota bacterium]